MKIFSYTNDLRWLEQAMALPKFTANKIAIIYTYIQYNLNPIDDWTGIQRNNQVIQKSYHFKFGDTPRINLRQFLWQHFYVAAPSETLSKIGELKILCSSIPAKNWLKLAPSIANLSNIINKKSSSARRIAICNVNIQFFNEKLQLLIESLPFSHWRVAGFRRTFEFSMIKRIHGAFR